MAKGFISIPPSWLLAGVAAIALLSYSWHCESVKEKHATYSAKVEAAGIAAQQDASDAIKENLANKERTDAETKRLRQSNAALSRSLHNARAHSRAMSAAASAASSTPRAPIQWADLLREIGRLDAGLSELAGDADQERIRLNSAKTWAGSVQGATE